MKKMISCLLSFAMFCVFAGNVLLSSIVFAQETLNYSCSNQIYRAFEEENLEAFTRETGINVAVHKASSAVSVNRLVHGYSDIASTARELYHRHSDYGYKQIPVCKDILAVVAKKTCKIDNISEEQLRDMLSGEITNWSEVGGADLPVMVIVPDEETAANKNFRRHVMKEKEIKHDFVTYDSSMVLEAIRYFPCGAISFVSYGAAMHYEDIAAIKIDNRLPTDSDYPYFQVFYYVTKGEPSGVVKKLIDFSTTGKGREIIKKNGMIPMN
ncbi:MAG: substrate-binding domain-containing protein [Desulfobacterales bacterium]